MQVPGIRFFKDNEEHAAPERHCVWTCQLVSEDLEPHLCLLAGPTT